MILGTQLWKDVNRGIIKLPHENAMADMYDLTVEKLNKFGMSRYEVSNFSRGTTNQCNHNIGYWNGKDYIGIGPGAHSRFRPFDINEPISQQIAAYSMRGKIQNIKTVSSAENIRDARIQTLEPEAWMREVEVTGHGTRKIDSLTPKDVLSEILATGLRTENGISENIWLHKLHEVSTHSKSYTQKILELTLQSIVDGENCKKFITNGSLILSGNNNLRLSQRGLKYLDHILPYLVCSLYERMKDY